MAYTYIWPITLPQVPQKGFTETGGLNIIRTPTDAGPAKQRVRGKRQSTLSVNFIMTTAQTTTLENFIQNTIKGTARFGFTHPRTAQIVETRIVPAQDGQLYNYTYLAPGYWTVALTFEVLP